MLMPKILFMGTSEFAVPSLEILIRKGYPIVGVVTQPNRPKGRGKMVRLSPVGIFAEKNHISVMQPEDVGNKKFLADFRDLSPDMVVLAAFGQILPREIIETPAMGCINVHPSLLPKYRGAAPINWAIIQGDEITGVTIMLMDYGLDSGDILLQKETMIGPEEAFGELHGRLSEMGSELLLKTIEMIVKGAVRRMPQDVSNATYARMLSKKDGHILWDNNVVNIINLIRGLSPSPGAYTFLEGKKLKIFTARGEEVSINEPAGKIGGETERGLRVAAGNGYIYLNDVQLDSRKRMSIHDFLRGCRIAPGAAFG
ncbi:MAG: methionyl-tRNA formyltransferase [Syntrophales bacterium]|nr:methionyl-tRNA formyltransferase [Syntrophales bacterium]